MKPKKEKVNPWCYSILTITYVLCVFILNDSVRYKVMSAVPTHLQDAVSLINLSD